MSHAFKAWEIPTGGKPPAYEIVYDDAPDGRRMVMVNSPWVLAIRRPDGALVPLDRGGARILDPGDELISPPSETADVDPRLLFQTQLQGYVDYTTAHATTFDDDGNIAVPAPDPDRWWWYRRELPHGRLLHLHQASTNARLSVSIAGDVSFQGSWCYPNHRDGWRAVLGWNGWGDPPDGWIRHLETARRRHDGTAATEYILAPDVDRR